MSENTFQNKLVRMWHKTDNGWCHAWDVHIAAFQTWKDGKTPLSSKSVILPNGEHPKIPSRVTCGSCGSFDLIPKDMKHEIIKT